MPKYSASLTIIDEEGNVLHDRELTPDEIICELLRPAPFIVHAGNADKIFNAVKRNIKQAGKLSDVAIMNRPHTTKYPKTPKSGKIKINVESRPEIRDRSYNPNEGIRAEVIDLVNLGLKAPEIAKKLNTSIANVYTIKSQAKKAGYIVPIENKAKSLPEKNVMQKTGLDEQETTPTKAALHEEILNMLRNGATVGEIAAKLGVRAGVVKLVKYSSEKKGEKFPN